MTSAARDSGSTGTPARDGPLRRAPTVLVVGDQTHARELLRVLIASNGYETITASTWHEALTLTRSGIVDLVLTDLDLPDMPGAVVVSELRASCDAPIIVVSACELVSIKIDVLDRGANDYLTRPFIAGELLARVRATQRIARPSLYCEVPTYRSGDLRIDVGRQLVWLAGKEVHLTPREHGLLAAFVRRAGRVVKHVDLLRDVWGPGCTHKTSHLRVYVHQLRVKIEPDPGEPRYLVTVSHVGYRLNTETPEGAGEA